MGFLDYEDKDVVGGYFENRPIEEIWYDTELVWPSASLSLSEKNIVSEGDATSVTVMVTIKGTQDKSYTINGLPSWMTVTNQTATEFTLNVSKNPSEDSRAGQLTAVLSAYPNVSDSASVYQAGSWLSQFEFDVVTTTPNQTVDRTVNLGAEIEGEALFDWGDGKIEILTVPKSSLLHLKDQKGDDVTINVGTDFPHTYSTAGTHRAIIKVRQGVNAFRFSTVPAGTIVGDWGAEFAPNPYVAAIHKINSNSLTSGFKMFAGLVNGSFASDFPGLETPNMTDFDFMFENFGNKGTYTVSDKMRFPGNMYQFIAHKDQVHKATRTYFKSGFEKIEKSMLTFSAPGALTSVFETFRQMGNVGADWTAKYAGGQAAIDYANSNPSNPYNLFLEEFVDTELFRDQPNISDFTGCFNAINDLYGNYDSGYSYKWLIKKDLFKYNVAQHLILDAMFNKCTRAVFETGFFADIAPRVHSMWLCFHGMNDGSPKVAYDMSIPGFNGADLNKMFPDASYPNMGKPINVGETIKRHMVSAFDFLPSNPSDNANVAGGFQCLPFGAASPASNGSYNYHQKYNQDWFYWRYGSENLRKNSLDIAAFLAKFPNVMPTSGVNPSDTSINPGAIDGAAYNFGNYIQLDDGGVAKSNAKTYSARPQVVEVKNVN